MLHIALIVLFVVFAIVVLGLFGKKAHSKYKNRNNRAVFNTDETARSNTDKIIVNAYRANPDQFVSRQHVARNAGRIGKQLSNTRNKAASTIAKSYRKRLQSQSYLNSLKLPSQSNKSFKLTQK